MDSSTLIMLLSYTFLVFLGSYAFIRYVIIPSIRTIRIFTYNSYVEFVHSSSDIRKACAFNAMILVLSVGVLICGVVFLASEYEKAFAYAAEHEVVHAPDTELQDLEHRELKTIEEEIVDTEQPIEDERTIFISEWAPRIDAYLSGSPLNGYGETFASAAYDYGVDPRYSVAISCIESGKGSNCFKSHNAWGWGNSSWSSWEEAIVAHTKGLADGYGYTVTESAAQKYCPPTWSDWYRNVRGEMGRI